MATTGDFFEKQYICPVCRNNFASLAVRSSHVYVLEKESDLHVTYRGVSPLHYSIIVCPSCYYAASNNSFTQEIDSKLADKLLLALHHLKPAQACDYTGERSLANALDAFKLAIRSAQLKQVRAGTMAGLFMGAAWLARENEDAELEEVYLKEALSSYLEAYNNDFQSIGNMSDVQATYLIGELYHRTGDYKEAITWFNQVIVHKYIKQYPQIEKLAREQWSLAREQSKSQPDPDESVNAKPAAPVEAKTDQAAPTASAQASPKTAVKRRPSMQLPAHLYSDQIDWLTHIVNNGYNSTKTLVSKEQVLRALLDAVMENLKDEVPQQFRSEEELKRRFDELLK